MTEQAYDGGASLKAEVNALQASIEQPAPSAPTESPSEGQETSAPAGGTPSDAPSTPAQELAEGRTPSGDSQPAAESDTADLKRALQMVGVDPAIADGLSPEARQHFLKLGKGYLDTNNRAGALGRELKALKRGQTPDEVLLDGEPEEPEQTLAEGEAGGELLEDTSAPPTSPDEPRVLAAVDKRAREYAEQDPDCIAVARTYHNLGRQISQIALQDPTTEAWSGTLPNIDRQLTAKENQVALLAANLDPETRQQAGLEPIDEITASDLRMRLTEARSEAADLRTRRSMLADQYRALREQRANVRNHYGQRLDDIKRGIYGQVAERTRQAETQKAIKRDAVKYQQEWKETFDPIIADLVPQALRNDADLKKDLWEAVKQAGLLHIEAHGAIKDFKEFQRQVVKRELERLDRHHRLRAKVYGDQKVGDATPPAPAGAGAVAQASPQSQANDPEAVLKANRNATRDLFRRRAAG